MRKQERSSEEFKIPVEGSLGILALGDIGLRAWRQVKKNKRQKDDEKK